MSLHNFHVWKPQLWSGPCCVRCYANTYFVQTGWCNHMENFIIKAEKEQQGKEKNHMGLLLQGHVVGHWQRQEQQWVSWVPYLPWHPISSKPSLCPPSAPLNPNPVSELQHWGGSANSIYVCHCAPLHRALWSCSAAGNWAGLVWVPERKQSRAGMLHWTVEMSSQEQLVVTSQATWFEIGSNCLSQATKYVWNL